MRLLLHGGAGLIDPSKLSAEREAGAREGLWDALRAGESVLRAGGHALDAVQTSIEVLEDCPFFNAGRGAVLAADGLAQLDAALMDSAGRVGAVAACRTTRNPIRLARAVLDDGLHVLLAGTDADAWARSLGQPQVPRDWFTTPARRAQLERLRGSGTVELDHDDVAGTVGAVALDSQGRLAAGNSTGGMANKRPGRVGDTPVIGAGTWCDERIAIAATGHGEAFVREGTALRLALDPRPLDEAAAAVLARIAARGSDGGLIALRSDGRFALPFNSGGMFRAWSTLEQHDVDIF